MGKMEKRGEDEKIFYIQKGLKKWPKMGSN
jgi:hypothetical protein